MIVAARRIANTLVVIIHQIDKQRSIFMVASIFKEGKRVLNLRDYQYFVCLSKSIIS